MKTSIRILLALCLTAGIYSCKNDDDAAPKPPEETATIIGNWRLNSGTFNIENAQILSISADNSLIVLAEDSMGFRDESRGNYTQTDTQLTIDFQFSGVSILNYTVTDNSLTIVNSSGDSVVFSKEVAAIDSEAWIKDISILTQGNAPWDSQVDIAYDGTHILVGNGYATNQIGFFNTTTLTIDSEMITTESAFAVEVEKYMGVDRYIFQSDNGSRNYTAFREDTGAEEYTSIDFGSWIKGIASVDATQVWIASSNENTLYLHDYGTAWPTQTIEQTILLDRSLEGLDYKKGFLYECSQCLIYKCQTSPNFEVVESTSLDGYYVHGIAFDGTNFWLYASTSDGTPNRIIKSSLTL
jgi:hypothetical protein